MATQNIAVVFLGGGCSIGSHIPSFSEVTRVLVDFGFITSLFIFLKASAIACTPWCAGECLCVCWCINVSRADTGMGNVMFWYLYRLYNNSQIFFLQKKVWLLAHLLLLLPSVHFLYCPAVCVVHLSRDERCTLRYVKGEWVGGWTVRSSIPSGERDVLFSETGPEAHTQPPTQWLPQASSGIRAWNWPFTTIYCWGIGVELYLSASPYAFSGMDNFAYTTI